ncbi:MAG: Ig-like domain-containing protein, partial [Planctomycetota bacterium]
VTVTVNADNDAPTADAGNNQTVDEGDSVSLAASASDPEGQGLTYTWTQVSGTSVTLADASTSSPSFTAPEGLANSDVQFQVSVSDGTNTTVDTVTVTVNADNHAPTANAGNPMTVTGGETVQLAATATDPEGQGMTYTWTQIAGPPVTLTAADTATPSFTAPEGVTDTDVQFQVSVSDGTNASVDTITVSIQGEPDPAISVGTGVAFYSELAEAAEGSRTETAEAKAIDGGSSPARSTPAVEPIAAGPTLETETTVVDASPTEAAAALGTTPALGSLMDPADAAFAPEVEADSRDRDATAVTEKTPVEEPWRIERDSSTSEPEDETASPEGQGILTKLWVGLMLFVRSGLHGAFRK